MAEFAVDLHTHTRFFHGRPGLGRMVDPIGLRLLGRVARVRGLDGFATTNHDYGREFALDDVAVVPGIEVTTTDGHLLIVGPDPPKRTGPGELTPGDAVELAHDRGCAAIVPHPFRNSTVSEADADFDAIEINGKGLDYERVARLARRLGLPMVGGSDAHYPIEVGRAFTRVNADAITPEAVVEAIVNGRVEPRLSTSAPQRFLRRIYHAIHTRKGWYDRPAPPGVGLPPGEDRTDGRAPDGGASFFTRRR